MMTQLRFRALDPMRLRFTAIWSLLGCFRVWRGLHLVLRLSTERGRKKIRDSEVESSFAETIDLCRKDEVAFCEAFNRMSPDGDFHFSPGQSHIGVMSFALGDLTYLIDEIQRLFEVGKTKDAVEMMIIDHAPSRYFRLQSFQFCSG